MEKENFNFEVLFEEKSENVERLFDVYRKNPYNARVIYMNNNKDMYSYMKVVLFTEGNTFNIVLFKKSFGISKTNRIYSSERRMANISYKNGKFYLINNGTVKPLTLHNLRLAFGQWCRYAIDYLKDNFTWLRFIEEKNILTSVAFNTIISKKLYSYKKAIIHTYNVPYPIGKAIHEVNDKTYNNDVQMFIHHFKKNLEYLENITSFDTELIKTNTTLFTDTIKMARILNKKVNCKWKLKRLKEMHDLWSEEITDITYMDADREMVIHPIFRKFSEFTNFTMLTTTKEMCLEGKKNKHCVATYVNRVESHTCAIYHIDGYTLEVKKDWGDKGLVYGQYRGYNNCSAPVGLDEMVQKYIKKFNVKVLGMSEKELYNEYNQKQEVLPF